MSNKSFALRQYYVTTDNKNLTRICTGGSWLYDGCETEEDAERAAWEYLTKEAQIIGVGVTCERVMRDLELEKKTREAWEDANIRCKSNIICDWPRQNQYRPKTGGWDLH